VVLLNHKLVVQRLLVVLVPQQRLVEECMDSLLPRPSLNRGS
jgi:hypothetical protein